MRQRIASKLQSISTNSVPTNSGHTKPGPKTEAAKNKVKVNSYVHGLTAQHLIIHESDQPHYDKMAEDFRLRFQPADGFERELLQTIIDTNWRLRICASVESAMFSNVSIGAWDDHDDTTHRTYMSRRGRTFTENANAFGGLGRYEAGLQRRFHSMLRELEAAIANRPEPDAGPLAEEIPAEPLVMGAACSQPQQNTPQTAANDSFRRASEVEPATPFALAAEPLPAAIQS